MSLKEIVEGSISDEEMRETIKEIAENNIRYQRARKWLDKAITGAGDHYPCSVIMNTLDFMFLRDHLRDLLDMETEAAMLKTGLMARYCSGYLIKVNRHFQEPIVIPLDIPKGTLGIGGEEEA